MLVRMVDRGACASAIRKCSMVIARFRHLQTSFLLSFLMKYKRKGCCVYKCGGRWYCVVGLAYQLGVYVPLKALFLVLIKCCQHSREFILDCIFFLLAGNKDNHTDLDDFKTWPDLPMDCRVNYVYPRVCEKSS